MTARRILCLIAAAFLLSLIVSAQVDQGAVARYNERGQMVTLFGIYGISNAEESRCSPITLTGVIISVEYDKRGEITNFHIKPRKGKALNVYLTGITSDGRLSTDEIRRMPTLISRNKKVRLVFYACGTTGAINEAEQITALNF